MTSNNTCTICRQEKPAIEFSTLTRWALDIKQPTGVCCGACYWRTLVVEHPSYRIGEDGKCIVDYVPYPAPRLEYVAEMTELLPGRLADTAVQAAFGYLGDSKAQARPFELFRMSLNGEVIG